MSRYFRSEFLSSIFDKLKTEELGHGGGKDHEVLLGRMNDINMDLYMDANITSIEFYRSNKPFMKASVLMDKYGDLRFISSEFDSELNLDLQHYVTAMRRQYKNEKIYS